MRWPRRRMDETRTIATVVIAGASWIALDIEPAGRRYRGRDSTRRRAPAAGAPRAPPLGARVRDAPRRRVRPRRLRALSHHGGTPLLHGRLVPALRPAGEALRLLAPLPALRRLHRGLHARPLVPDLGVRQRPALLRRRAARRAREPQRVPAGRSTPRHAGAGRRRN